MFAILFERARFESVLYQIEQIQILEMHIVRERAKRRNFSFVERAIVRVINLFFFLF